MKFADIPPVKQRKRTEKSRFASQISRPKPVLSKLKSVGNESQSFNIVYANWALPSFMPVNEKQINNSRIAKLQKEF